MVAWTRVAGVGRERHGTLRDILEEGPMKLADMN